MSLVNINKIDSIQYTFALWRLGFRPFFLGASIFAVVSIFFWMLIYTFQFPLESNPLTILQWHSHEMIYGYSMAVIAGFLLTAIANWTGVQTISGIKLAILFSLWLVARILLLFGSKYLSLCAIFDLSFMLYLSYAVTTPIIAVKQWRQLGVLTKIGVLTLGNLSFYLGAFGLLDQGTSWGIYGGLYLVISLILNIGSRIVPGFITNGVDETVNIQTPKWIAPINIVLFIVFFVNQLFIGNQLVLGYSSIGLLVANTWRLVCWHTPGIWKKPLLWCLYSAFIFIDVGFLLFALNAFIGISPFLAIHAFAFGGIGLATLSMMARVTLGHTGRSIKNPPKITSYFLGILILGAVVRVGFPFFDSRLYLIWILVSQILWILAFSMFIWTYGRMLFAPRLDGQAG